ncbi:hypothetical protein, unlikely [Trypanosoma brucei gambiense DAL972]|uniref:Uncharacterized protein n=1 Tax=Trypanosoma brucei gambiense (strain MHOM/CI/86/DAL972) TaxID=679716 RepID=C9ZRL4_TRYB9|nr:hypothetical protein, unlikely [Trypanosoma brucei gambiense DAL972]CBH12316.1 hypothetical protein, unlikely [Trypanosoma brucei gambiense DAL972]|eukprot:XP_011774597.1 hypothetical protein, unlikely [Trypanosoma brucei gambiense DAL972]
MFCFCRCRFRRLWGWDFVFPFLYFHAKFILQFYECSIVRLLNATMYIVYLKAFFFCVWTISPSQSLPEIFPPIVTSILTPWRAGGEKNGEQRRCAMCEKDDEWGRNKISRSSLNVAQLLIMWEPKRGKRGPNMKGNFQASEPK